MDTQPEDLAPDDVEEHSHVFFSQAGLIVGQRLAEMRFDPDRGLRVTVIDLSDQDRAGLAGLAEQLGIERWVRVERAAPEALEAWRRLRIDLVRLRQKHPGALQGYPTAEPGYRRPPIGISLAADAVAIASELHACYGDFVSLRVGALLYPAELNPTSAPQRFADGDDRRLVEPGEMRIELDTPLRIRTGKTATHGLLITNLSDREINLHTNGHVVASIVDAETGLTVGGFTGWEHSPLIIVTAAPSETVRVRLLVGTASFRPELGYTVPPGSWHLTAPLNFGDGRHLVSAPLEVTISG